MRSLPVSSTATLSAVPHVGGARPRGSARPVAFAVLVLAWAAVSAGCFLVDDAANDPRHDVRGYTECGSMFGEAEWCQPGQYCADQTFSDCVNGCLSDVNCASNQFCEVDRHTGVGVCLNTRTVVYRLVEGGAEEGSGAAALEGSDAQ